MKRLIVEGPEIPKDGWFHDTLMEELVGREIMDLQNYPRSTERKLDSNDQTI